MSDAYDEAFEEVLHQAPARWEAARKAALAARYDRSIGEEVEAIRAERAEALITTFLLGYRGSDFTDIAKNDKNCSFY